VTPELADPLDAVEVGKAEDVEEFGASPRREGLEALAQGLLHLLEGHAWTVVRLGDWRFSTLWLTHSPARQRRVGRPGLALRA
jgi:hypothetical protein